MCWSRMRVPSLTAFSSSASKTHWMAQTASWWKLRQHQPLIYHLGWRTSLGHFCPMQLVGIGCHPTQCPPAASLRLVVLKLMISGIHCKATFPAQRVVPACIYPPSGTSRTTGNGPNHRDTYTTPCSYHKDLLPCTATDSRKGRHLRWWAAHLHTARLILACC